MTELLHLIGLVKQEASFNESEKPCNHRAATTWGSVFPIFYPLCNRIWSLYNGDTQRGGCLRILPSIKEYLTLKLTDNLISQSSTGGKSSLCEPELAMLQVSVHAFLKCAHCDHMTRKLLSDWPRCVLKLPLQERTLSATHNSERRRSIWL